MSGGEGGRPPRGLRAVVVAFASWRTAAVSLLSFSSGMPLGLVWIAIPAWMARIGVDIRIIGLFTLAQAPWTFKFLWAPAMDRYRPPWLGGGKRGWTLVTQVGLLVTGLMLAGVGSHPDAIWVVAALALAISLLSASQDIAIDAYAVEVLEEDEQGIAVGARVALYRAAMFVAGGLAITVAGMASWQVVNAVLALLYLPMMIVTRYAPEPTRVAPPPENLTVATWRPLVEFLSRPRALEILAFVVMFKIADNLAQSLVRPFLIQAGFSDVDVGVATSTIGLAATLLGTFLGGALTTALGLGHALWLFGLLQIFSNLGYAAVAHYGTDTTLMYTAVLIETGTSGMGTGAFSVLLLRLTRRRFSATQYALLSSLFALPRIVAGPITGVLANAIGWRDFFLLTLVAGVPGMVLLHRFVPLGVRDPDLEGDAARDVEPVTRRGLALRFATGTIGGTAFALGTAALLGALGVLRADPEAAFDLTAAAGTLFAPVGVRGWLKLLGCGLVGLFTGLCAAAFAAARSGSGEPSPESRAP